MVIFIVILVFVRIFHRRGQIRLASFMLVFGMWATYMTVIIFTGTIRTSAIVMPIAIVAMIVPILGLKVGFVSAIVTLLVTLGITLLEITGNPLPSYFPAAPLNNWFHLITAFAILIVPLGLAWRDISAALARARKSEERYRAVVESQTEFIVRCKIDGTHTFVNQAYCHHFGITPEQALGTNFYDSLWMKTGSL
jgi:PAS domain-containing protein